jgi:hypothetical protein
MARSAPGFVSENVSVLKPWGVAGDRAIQFPVALAGGPSGRACRQQHRRLQGGLGDAVGGRLLADAFDAGVPAASSTMSPAPAVRSEKR